MFSGPSPPPQPPHPSRHPQDLNALGRQTQSPLPKTMGSPSARSPHDYNTAQYRPLSLPPAQLPARRGQRGRTDPELHMPAERRRLRAGHLMAGLAERLKSELSLVDAMRQGAGVPPVREQ